MRLIANLDQHRHGHIMGYIHCSQFGQPQPRSIHLLVDTGSSKTTLLSDDVTRLSINCSALSLSRSSSSTATGPVVPYVLPNVQILMELQYGWFNRKRGFGMFPLDTVNCMRPTNPQTMTPVRIRQAFSLLGMDILSLFRKWRFTDTELILEP